MNNASNEILIVGSGFAGLIAAITLKISGIPVKIFEAKKTTLNIGGSITMFPNSMKVLRLIGVADEVIINGVKMQIAKFQNNFGRHLVNRSMGKESVFGEPTITLKRSKLNESLIRKAEKLGIDIVYSKKVINVFESDKNITLEFEDKTRYNGKIVIGCDGINSSVRKYVLGKTIVPKYSGLIYFGGFVKNQKLIKNLNLDINTQYISIGPTHFFAYSYVDNPIRGNASVLWYCYLSQPNRLSKNELDKLDDKKVIKRVLSAHKGWHEPVQKLIKNTVEVCKSSISDIIEIDNWHKGKSLVIGDAAHALNPLSGQGAGIAMEDGFLIAKLIEKYNNDYALAFNNLVKLRKKRTTLIARKARKSSKKTTIKLNKYVVIIRNRTFAILTYLTPEKILNKFLFYDVEKELDKIKKQSVS
ncbi:MAG: FAD-dependent monooxygenase [Flavobacteriales bacterium]|nr:FAD-dependent monooxygenase [Flavobacteriales bacterium]